MTLAIYDFTPFAKEPPKFNLRLLLNIEDLNNSIFDEVFNNILKPHQQEQYIVFKDSEEAKKYREERNSKLPYIDFNNLPEVLDDVLLEEIMSYKKDRYLRRMIHDLLSEEQNYQITQHERKDRELITKEEIKRVDEAFEKKRNERKINGNMGESSTVDEYILRYGVGPA